MKNGVSNIKKLLKPACCLLLALAFAGLVFVSACTQKGGQTADDGKPTAAPQSDKPTETPLPQTEPPETDAPATEPPATEAPTAEPRTAEALFGDVVLARKTDLNYFAIPDIILSLMTDADIEVYKRMVTAYMAGETSIEIPTELGEYPDIRRLLDMYCPVFYIDVDDTTVVDDGTTISWSYTDPSQHDAAIDRFEARVHELLSSVVATDSELLKILTVYKDFTEASTYDDTTTRNGFRYRHAVNAIMDGRGVCWCFARGFNFLICQLGATSLTIHGIREWDDAVHEWVVFRDGSEWRYCDPTWDIGGWSLNYFGFTMRVRDSHGFPRSQITVLEGTRHKASDYFNVSDTFFSPLYSGAVYGDYYEIDHENNCVVFISEYDGAVHKAVFDVGTGEYHTYIEYD